MRNLTDEDVKLAGELDKAIAAALKADHWDEAIANSEKLLALRTRGQGPKHFESVSAEWRLRALRRVAPMPHEDRIAFQSANIMTEQAQALDVQGKHAEAQLFLEKAIRSAAVCSPTTTPKRQAATLGWPLTSTSRESTPPAQPLCEKALQITRRLLTDDHPDTANKLPKTWPSTSTARASTPRPSRPYEKVLEIFRRLLTDDHPDTAGAYAHVAYNLEHSGKICQAQPLYE